MRKILLLITSLAMAISAFAQDVPAVDKIKTSSGTVEMHFIGHGSLLFSINDYNIFIDPVRSSGKYETLTKADLILVTHEHGDHLDPDLIGTLRKDATVMLSSETAARSVSWAQSMKAGDKKVINGIEVLAVPAYNIVNTRAPGQPFHPKGSGIGFVLTIGDTKIYVAGDTENIPEMKELKNINVAFLPMNLPYTMTPEMVADAAKSFRPKILYPYHFGNTNTNLIISLLKDSGIEVRIRNLK
jgi:L-ascorbate metabolism protein UlaG (beta-lactamase superfamily)